MIHHQHERSPRQYAVRVGHWTVRVQGDDRHGAVLAARRQLCEELPRLWDVIRALDERQFLVEEVRMNEGSDHDR